MFAPKPGSTAPREGKGLTQVAENPSCATWLYVLLLGLFRCSSLNLKLWKTRGWVAVWWHQCWILTFWCNCPQICRAMHEQSLFVLRSEIKCNLAFAWGIHFIRLLLPSMRFSDLLIFQKWKRLWDLFFFLTKRKACFLLPQTNPTGLLQIYNSTNNSTAFN